MDCILIATLNHYKLIQKRALHKQKMKVEITINIKQKLVSIGNASKCTLLPWLDDSLFSLAHKDNNNELLSIILNWSVCMLPDCFKQFFLVL